MKRLVVICAVLAALALAATARADIAVLPPTQALPWSDPAHQTSLELFASHVASEIAGRPVTVRCFGPTDWPDANELGYVQAPAYSADTWLFTANADGTNLAPTTCWHLWQFAMAPAKPTKCAAPPVTTRTIVYRLVRYRVRVHGRWVWRSKRVATVVSRTVAGPTVPCYPSTMPAVGLSEYQAYAYSLLTLTHESMHLYDFRLGWPVDVPAWESRAECFGMQNVAWTATQFGDTADDAQTIARYLWETRYPGYAGTVYWSADCRENGPMDLSPGDGVWP